jgi:hypothetical protein
VEPETVQIRKAINSKVTVQKNKICDIVTIWRIGDDQRFMWMR